MKHNLLAAWLAANRLSLAFTEVPDAASDVALRQEFEDLFMGTNAAIYIPLWASVCKYDDGSLLDKTTLKVVQFYHRWGYSAVPMDGNPPDYIAQQLRFLCYLFACALHAAERDKDNTAYLNAAEEFTSLYLLDTVRVVAAGLRRHAQRDVFHRLADDLVSFCRGEFSPLDTSMQLPEKSLLCYEAYVNGPAPAIPDCKAETIYTTGRNNCGGRCSIRATVQDGCIIDLETGCDIGEPTLHACVRGRGYRTTYMSGTRLRYPMKRIGKRGEGRFKRISWDEAADIVASELTRVRKEYGPGARFVTYGVGLNAVIRPDYLIMRLMNLDGGFLGRWSTYSYNHSEYTTPFIYGDTFSGSSTEDHLNAKLIILWAHNPTETIWSPQLSYTLMRAKEQGTKIIVIDPRRSDSALALADEWIPIAPSTDAALANAMAYVIFEEGLQDQEFMDRCCLGFDEEHMPEGVDKTQNFKNYLFGGIDGVAKTPEWAEAITRVEADTIRRLARLYATTKPACLLPGLGHQRTGNGEQAVRALCALPCMTGNVGIPGGFAGGIGFLKEEAEMRYPIGERAYPGVMSCFTWMQAIEDGVNMTREKDHLQGVEKLDTNIKMVFTLASNILINQHSNINHSIEVLQDESKCECIVGSDVFMTASMKFVDLLLPAPTFLEEDNVSYPWLSGHYLLHSNQVVAPLFGCRTEYDWIGDTARRMGLWESWSMGHKTHGEWLRDLYNEIRPMEPELPPYEEFKAKGGYSYKNPRTYIAYAEQCKDPEKHPFATPSGKIEIYSKQLRDFADAENIPPLPIYVPCSDGPEDPLREKYPLQLIGFHTKRRCHSIHDNNPRLEEVDPQRLWIHPVDATERGLKNGDLAEIYNDRGKTRIPVFVTERVMRGVVAMAQGAWYTPDEKGVDTRGSINILTSSKPSPLARANPQHTNLVEVTAYKA